MKWKENYVFVVDTFTSLHIPPREKLRDLDWFQCYFEKVLGEKLVEKGNNREQPPTPSPQIPWQQPLTEAEESKVSAYNRGRGTAGWSFG